ncbi:TIGR01459 family HAD-type hydrolase [Aurantimonas marina]|uniref:TIGR01459 family HAD-type hydrolase n=1 Tax=Aurantimonas marina TaxID=2780508 RepID=UPI0019D26B66|nr:TIGR01459 family HAD-type hydrolase [Aurantimonas marina]
MDEHVTGLEQIADTFDAVVLDQWGVLHDGDALYPGVLEALERLADAGKTIALLSNSGKRAAPNRDRLAGFGIPVEGMTCIVTSGEVLWDDLANGVVKGFDRLFPVAATPEDAEAWIDGLDGIALADSLSTADAILMMGLPDNAELSSYQGLVDEALARRVPVLCANPDRASPRPGGKLVVAPGALAARYEAAGGRVIWYGKPHARVFEATAEALGNPQHDRILMVGDSLQHDVAGASAAGWRTLFVRDGLHAQSLADKRGGDLDAQIEKLASKDGAPLPDYTIGMLQWASHDARS